MQAVASLYPPLSGGAEIPLLEKQIVGTNCDLIYLTAWQALNFETHELESLIKYLQRGGVILIEVPTNSSMLIEDTKNLINLQLEIPLQAWHELKPNHPLRQEPFLFAALPKINQQPVQLWNGGGIVLVNGDLSFAWGVDENLSLERNDIRTAQELGINILNFAYLRRQIAQCLQ
jgi:hypothetical protein